MPGSSAEGEATAGLAGPSRLRIGLTLVVAFAVLSLLWSLPGTLAGFGWSLLGTASLEIALIFGVLALLSILRTGMLGRIAAATVALATTAVVTLELADLVIRESLARPLNPLLDVHLAKSLGHLLTETLGGVMGWLALGGLGALPLLVGLAAFALIRAVQRVLDRPRARYATLAACGVLVGLFALQQVLDVRRSVSNQASLMLARQWRASEATAAGLMAIESAIASDRFRDVPAASLLGRLNDADVLLMFVESYGRSALELPRYARTLAPALEAFEERLGGHNLLAASGWLRSPTVGGQSWLAHGTLESGLWLPDQAQYDALVQSERLTLTRAFAAAGYRTVALKPAITRPWPEGDRLGFARIYAAADLGYVGKPYNWVTMPDQYTLAALERLERASAEQPLFVEVSLISSHAPWTPIPPVLDDWSAIGDGSVFSRWADDGDPPEVVWRDPERVREQYVRAIDYVLGVLASYAASFVDERTLLILVGDHQPAPLITGEVAGHDVPIHVISGDPTLLEPFLDWGFVPGMRPSPDTPAKPMDAFRDFFLDAFQGLPDETVAGSPG
jgi:Sulfatase